MAQQKISEPLFYRHVILATTQSLQLFATNITGYKHVWGRDLGQWVLTLHLGMATPANDRGLALPGLPSLLPCLRNLHSFSAVAPQHATPDVLAPLLASCSASLRKLEVVLGDADGLGGLSLAHIRGFRNLEELAIRVLWQYDADVIHSVSNLPDLDMPRLRMLTWAASEGTSSRFILHLSRARFPALETLNLQLPLMDHQIPTFHVAVKAHPAILNLGIEVDENFQPDVLTHDLTVAHILFIGDVPPPIIIDFLSPSIQAISISAQNSHRDKLCLFIKALLGAPGSLCVKEVRLVAHPPFLWKLAKRAAIEAQQAQMLGLMLLSASQLAQRGIKLVDGDGFSPDTLFDTSI